MLVCTAMRNETGPCQLLSRRGLLGTRCGVVEGASCLDTDVLTICYRRIMMGRNPVSGITFEPTMIAK